MKKVTIFTVMIIMFAFSGAQAAIITVDNKTPSIGDYTTLQAAHDAASDSDGDVIYVYPSDAVYQGITVTKKIRFVGTGFDYPSEEMSTTLIAGTMTFNAGSDGSVLDGFGSSFHVAINANDITIKRNKLSGIDVAENHTGTVILQNYLHHNGGTAVIVRAFNEVLIANNNLDYIFANYSSITITILHNVIRTGTIYAIQLANADKYIANNIIIGGTCSGTNSGYYHNMSNSNQLPSGNGNIGNVDMSTVFVDPDNNDLHLLPGSPAIGAGQNGVDMGMYGGDTPYVDGGRPGLPSIFQLESDHVGSQQNGLDVTIKAKSNRE